MNESSTDRVRVSVATATDLLRQLFDQKMYGPGQRIESERVLANRLECSRQTIRGALECLEKEGLLWRHVGQGTFMGPRPNDEFIRPQVLYELTTPAKLMAARLTIEPSIAAAAAIAGGVPDLNRLRGLAQKSRDAASWQEYELLDDAFHKAIAVTTGNNLLIAILGMLSSVRGRARWQREHDLVFRKTRQYEYAHHQGLMHIAIVDAIAAGNAEGAASAMHHHLQEIRSLIAPE